MPFETGKNATELGVDKSRKFKVVDSGSNSYIINCDIVELVYDNNDPAPFFRNLTQPDKGCANENWTGLGFSCCWSRLEYADEHKLPPYILCSTPELARKVLEKIERDFPDKRWGSKLKPTEFIPSLYYPGLVIYTEDIFIYFSKEYFENNYKGEHLTTAEEYLGLATTTTKVATEEKLIKPMGNKFMSNIIEFAKNLSLSKDDKTLKKVGLIDEQGKYTSTYEELIMKKIMDDNKPYAVEMANKMLEEEKKDKK